MKITTNELLYTPLYTPVKEFLLTKTTMIDNAFYCRVNERIRATPEARQRNSGLRIVAVAR